ncbi:MAG: hypothetical protein JKY95_00355, partial [Planctomycetaceae bacterium]|nr:hypothetical protein [Planctomycetaceae bacterium]
MRNSHFRSRSIFCREAINVSPASNSLSASYSVSVKRRAVVTLLLLATSFCLLDLSGKTAWAQSSSVAPMIRLIDAGRLPDSRLPTVLALICKRGDEVDLQYVFEKSLNEKGFSPEVRLAALKLLSQTARDRKLKPAGDLSSLKQLLDIGDKTKDVPLQKQVIKLIGQWKVTKLADELDARLKDSTQKALAGSIIESLASLGGDQAKKSIRALTSSDHPNAIREQAIASLAGIDLKLAATSAAIYLKDATKTDNINMVIQPFLVRKNGSELLGNAVSEQKISPDIAKLALRAMLTAGRNDPLLSDPLSKAAGLDTKMEPLTKAELLTLTQEVIEKGNTVRGEQIFRREGLSCYKCHALGKAGGKIGPDLSPIGGSSPIDYLTNALLLPSQAIKEAYKTRLIVDADGLQHIGIVVDEDDDRVILRDAQGKEKTIAVDDIEFEKEGDSLMPTGLTKFLTHDELVDLIRFLSALGKEPDYTMSATPTVYRWRVYQNPPSKVTGKLFSEESVRNYLFEYAPERWKPIYSLASGQLPVDEAKKLSNNQFVFVYAEVDASIPGNLKLGIDSTDGIILWVNDKRVAPEAWENISMTKGRHKLLFRIDTQVYQSKRLRLTVEKGPSPAAEFSIVVGE